MIYRRSPFVRARPFTTQKLYTFCFLRIPRRRPFLNQIYYYKVIFYFLFFFYTFFFVSLKTRIIFAQLTIGLHQTYGPARIRATLCVRYHVDAGEPFTTVSFVTTAVIKSCGVQARFRPQRYVIIPSANLVSTSGQIIIMIIYRRRLIYSADEPYKCNTIRCGNGSSGETSSRSDLSNSRTTVSMEILR